MSHTIIEGVVQLVQEMLQKLDDRELYLSAKAWAELDNSLEKVHPLLAPEEVEVRDLEVAAWLLIAAFEVNKTLAEQFAHTLAVMVGGTKLTGRELRRPQDKTRLIKNKMIMLTFAERIKGEAQTSRQQRRTRQRS